MSINKEFAFNLYAILTLIGLKLLSDIIIEDIPLLKYGLYGILLELTFFTTSAIIYYINYTFCIPRFLVRKKYYKYLLSFIGMCVLFFILRFFLEEVVVFNITGQHNYVYTTIDAHLIGTYFFDSFYYTLRICLFSGVISLMFRYKEGRERIYQLELEKKQAQLSVLKSQISPHFLFNTLNNFYVELMDDKPETANDILKLSGLLRYVTYTSSDNFTLLEKELEFIKDYIHFYKRRYEDNLHIHLTINGAVKNQKVPALILIHFVENVCKHGIINDKNRPAKIRINVFDNALEVITENYINVSEKYMEGGIGTENIISRLNAIFNENYRLNNTKDDLTFKTYLKIPLQE